MTKPKNAAGLAHPVAPSRWAQIRQAERVDYSTAQPARVKVVVALVMQPTAEYL